MANILIVEDDKAIQNLISISLKQEGHKVYNAYSAIEGMDITIKNVIDLIILDLGLPDMDGINVVKQIRQYNERLPILIVSARDSEEEKIKCLDAGVNDYIVKPFSSLELMARVRAALRYSSVVDEGADSTFINGNLKIDYIAHQVFISDKEVHLTNYEYKLLCVLARNMGKTLTHNFIISKVWGAGGNDANGLRVFMANIRRKLETDIYKQELFRTEVGVGYRMNKLD